MDEIRYKEISAEWDTENEGRLRIQELMGEKLYVSFRKMIKRNQVGG